MDKGILDTDILSEISKGVSQVVSNNAALYIKDQGYLTFTSVSVYEILYGLRAKPAPGQAQRFLQLISGHQEMVPDAEDYRVGAEIRAAMHRAGTEIGKADPVIAACAYRRNLVLITANIKHYQFIVDAGFPLTLENWRNP